MAAPKGNQYAKGHKSSWGDRPLTDLLRRALKQGDAQRARKIAENLLDQAAANDPRAIHAIKEVFDRIEGKPTQPISGPDGGPLEIRVKQF